MIIRYLLRAEARFFAVLSQLQSVNPFAVERLLQKVERAHRRLSTFPSSGPHVPEFPDLPLRQFFVEPYRFFYSIDERRETVWIVDVWHGAQISAEPHILSPTR